LPKRAYVVETGLGCCLSVRSHSETTESNVTPRILTVSEKWITESSNLTKETRHSFKRCDYLVKLFRKNSNLCDHSPPTSQTDGWTDRQTTCDHKTALCTLYPF